MKELLRIHTGEENKSRVGGWVCFQHGKMSRDTKAFLLFSKERQGCCAYYNDLHWSFSFPQLWCHDPLFLLSFFICVFPIRDRIVSPQFHTPKSFQHFPYRNPTKWTFEITASMWKALGNLEHSTPSSGELTEGTLIKKKKMTSPERVAQHFKRN